MKQNKRILQIAIILTTVLLVAGNVLAEKQERGWGKGRSRQQRGDGQQMVERMLERIAQDDPEKAKELRELHQEDPEEFREQMHQYMQEKHGQRSQGQGQRSSPEHFQGKRSRSGGGMQGTGKGPRHADMQKDGRRRGHGRSGKWKEHIQKRHEEFVKWLEKNYPKVAKNLEKLKEKDTAEYIKQVAKKGKKYREIMEAEKKNPQYAKVLKEDITLKQARDKTIKKLKNAKGKQKEQLKAELEEIVTERFDIVIKKKEFKYNALKQKLEKMQKQVAKRQAELDKLVQSKDEAIVDRIKELIGESEKLNWE